jgi:hypothetical protein
MKNDKVVYKGKILEIVERTIEKDGRAATYEIARRAPGIRLIIETPDGKFILNKEKRHELEKIDYRLPGGKVFDRLEDYNAFLENNGDLKERAKEAAELEALQEVGIKVLNMEYMSTSHCGATVEWDLFYFVVKSYEKVGQQLEEDEEIENIEVSREELKEYAMSGKIQEDRSVAVILKYLNK